MLLTASIVILLFFNLSVTALTLNGLNGHCRQSLLSRRSHALCMVSELDTGDFECEFTKTEYESKKISNLSQYTLKAKIPAKEMNVYLDEYKEEMRKRKVVFLGSAR